MVTAAVTVKPDPPHPALPIVALPVACAWCGPVMHTSEPVSHGICPKCVDAFFPELGLTMKSEFSEIAS